MNDDARRAAIGRLGITIAIDGPAGSGKSTVSKAVASRAGIGYLDTGAMYRALTWFALESGVDFGADGSDGLVASLADRMRLRLDSDPHDPHVWVGDAEVTAAIREPRIALAIRHVSTNLRVRAWMAQEQRRRMMEARAQGSGMIAEGRDITTVVCPDDDGGSCCWRTRRRACAGAPWSCTATAPPSTSRPCGSRCRGATARTPPSPSS